MKKKVISMFLISAMALSFASCSALGGGSKITEKSFDKYVAEELEAEEADIDDVNEWIEEEDEDGDLKDGVVFEADDDDYTDFMEESELDMMFGEFSKLENTKTYFMLNMKKEKATMISFLTFKDEKAAAKFLKGTVDQWDDELCDKCDDWAIADEEENEALGKFTMRSEEIYLCLYQFDGNVCLILSIDDESTIEDFAEHFKLDNPVEVLDVKDKKDKDDDDDDDDDDDEDDD